MILFFDGRRTHSSEVTTCIGLSHGNGQNNLTTNTTRQKPLALLFTAKTREIRAHQTAMQRVIPVTHPRIGRLFDNNLLETKIRIAHAPVLLIRPDHQKALFTGLSESVTVNNSSLTPGLHLWHNLYCEKFPIGVSEHVLLFSEFSLQHTV